MQLIGVVLTSRGAGERHSDGRAEAGKAFLKMQSRSGQARPVPVNRLTCSVFTMVLFGVVVASGALNHIPSSPLISVSVVIP